MLLDLCLRGVVRFVLVFECRVNFAEPDLGAGLDDESLAVVHCRAFSYGLAVDAGPDLYGARHQPYTCQVSRLKWEVVALFLFEPSHAQWAWRARLVTS